MNFLSSLKFIVIKTYDARRHLLFKSIEKIGLNEPFLPIYYRFDNLIEELSNENSEIFVLVDDNTVVGFIVYENTNNSIHIKSICVDNSFKQKGIGRMLITYIKRKDKDISLYVQCVNINAIQFYLTIGFHLIEYIGDYYSTLNDKPAYKMILKVLKS